MTSDSADRGVSPQVGIILLFGLVAVGGVLVFTVGFSAIDAFQSQASAERGEQMMLQFDDDLQTSLLDNSTRGSAYFDGKGEYELVSDGSIEITAVNEYAQKSTTIPLGTLRYQDQAGNVFAHQAGGVWQGEGSDARVLTEPGVRYYQQGGEGRVDLSITNLSGNIDSGENEIIERPSSRTGDLSQDIGFVNYIEIRVTGTSYHEAWADFLQDEFDASRASDCDITGSPSETIVCHDESAESVTVIAPIEGENPFASHVGINPTIYGGLYADGETLTLDDSLTVDRYNGSEGWTNNGNVTEDLLVANQGLQLDSGANVTGVPVVNGVLSGANGAETSSIAFATDPAGNRIDVVNGTEVYNVTGSDPPDVFGAKLSQPFGDIDAIDQQVDRAIRLITEYDETTTGATGVLTSNSDSDGFYSYDRSVDGSDISGIDTSDGAVHVAVDGNLDLEDITVTGGGKAYFYVSGDITGEKVTVDSDEARKLWVYGTSDAEITLRDEFQGIVYAPKSDSLTITDDTDVYGAVVAGSNVDIGEDVGIHFDETTRTDVPIPEENRDVTVQIAQRRPPLDVTFVLDRSGSMSSNDPERKRVDATRKFLGLMKGEDSNLLEGDQGDQAGVYEFNQNGYEIHHLSDDLEEVNDSIRTAEEGSTDMSAGMKPALDQYEINGGDTSDRHMVLLSDGENTVDRYVDWDCWCYRYASNNRTMNQAERASEMNVTIHTIGLGDNIDQDMLEDIAAETGGDFYTADNNEELEEIFEGIADDVTAAPPTTFEIASLDESMSAPADYAVNVREQAIQIGS